MRDWASGGQVKIDRAKEHIRDFESRVAAFKALSPYHVIRDYDFEAQRPGELWTRFLIIVIHDLPLTLAPVVADTIHNLNVALDYLWQRAVYGPRSVKNDHFPVFKAPECAESRFRGKEKGRCKTAVDILKRVEAFEVGNPFWVIRQFDDADKHDTMRLVATELRGFTSRFFSTRGLIDIDGSLPESEWKPIEDRAVLFTVQKHRLGPAVDVQHDLAFEIAFGDGEILQRQAVLESLHNLMASVESLAGAFASAGLLRSDTA